jgi:hypothetical protein
MEWDWDDPHMLNLSMLLVGLGAEEEKEKLPD